MHELNRKRFAFRRVPIVALIGLFLLVGCDSGGGGGSLTLSVPPDQDVIEGSTLTFTVSGSGAPAASLSYSVAGAPANATLDPVTGAFNWTPTFDQIGLHLLTFGVTNGTASREETVRVDVDQDEYLNPDPPLRGGGLDALEIPKYVTPLVIPPVMNDNGAADSYDIALRQFRQQILPGGIWNTINGRRDAFGATTVWSYGPAADAVPDSTLYGGGAGIAPAPNSQFNYPAYTIETIANAPVNVRWINDLVDANGNYRPHLLPVDQTLHWANPPLDCADGGSRTDCAGDSPIPYDGPVPMVPHVHGAHVEGHSDGYPEAWWLPAANDIPVGYATAGTLFDDATGTNPGNLGYADYVYRNDQPATTLWFHDHSLGMTRQNVYAGPAGFWLIRGDHTPLIGGGAVVPDSVDDTGTVAVADGVLPGPAPVAGQDVLALNVPGDPVRSSIREIPVVIQDRSFNQDGSLFYPDRRAYFEEIDPAGLMIDFIDGLSSSDIAPLWNPEAFFNVMVVNGVSWPKLEVAQAKYRFRLLNGCNSRFLNLALFRVNPATGRIDTDPLTGGVDLTKEIPMYVIGTEQGALPNVVKVSTGFATDLPSAGPDTPAPHPDQALLMGLAERADVIVDFSALPDGTVVRMINTAPDSPFGGFDGSRPDPLTTGQVMQFVVDASLNGLSETDPTGATPATEITDLALSPEAQNTIVPGVTRQVSLNEEESNQICVAHRFDPLTGAPTIEQLTSVVPAADETDILRFVSDCFLAGGEPFAPKAALLGQVDFSDPLEPDGLGVPLRWTDNSGVSTPVAVTLQSGAVININVTENPTVGDTEEWEIYNFTEDAHPIHLHLVRFQVIERRLIGSPPGSGDGLAGNVQAWEAGYKDTVIAYPDEITTVKATFDLAGLYVWHCHILEHEDNEMMRPYVVSP